MFWLVLTSLLCFGSPAHDFHISRSEINYDVQSGDIQIAIHVFIDDFETALAASGVKKLNLCTKKESLDADLAMERYINKKLVFSIGGKIHSAKFIGKETSEDLMAVWCYLENSGMKNTHQMSIENKVLLEVFNDQKNIMDFTVNKKKKSFAIFDIKKFSEVVYIK